MKKPQALNSPPAAQDVSDDLSPEYRFDYRKARPNRFATAADQEHLVGLLDADVAQVFTTSEAVNAVLRALIETMPPRS